jgi:hypothetical protein
MIPEFVAAWELRKHTLLDKYRKQLPSDYDDIVKDVIQLINPDDDYDLPDPERITVIDHGQYSGTRLYVIGATGYEPDRYWWVKVEYGSCSGCDTLEHIQTLSYDEVTEEQAKQAHTLALHIVQELREMK